MTEHEASPSTSPDSGLADGLRGAQASGKVVRGAVVRTVGYGVGTIANVLASVVLLRYLGVEQFGRYVAVMSVVAIAGGISDGGLTAVGNRELARLTTTQERRIMLSQLFGMRLLITPVAVCLAVAFTFVGDYDGSLVAGTALAGVGWTLVAISSSLAMPLSVDLKITALTALEVTKQVGSTLVIVVMMMAGAGLMPMFSAAIPGALLAIFLTPVLAGRNVLGAPTFQFREWGELLRSSLPIAFAAALGIVYLRFLTVLMFQFTDEAQTGIFGTSSRIIEAIGGLPLLAFMVALPVMSLSNNEGRAQLRTILQRMVEVGLLFAGLLVTFLVLGAPWIIDVVGGPEYSRAVPVLRIQSLSLFGSLLAMACLMGAIAMDLRKVIVTSNLVALATVVVFGVPLVFAAGAVGAGLATVVGEVAMAITFWLLIGLEDRESRPSLVPGWKPLLATASGIAVPVFLGVDGIAGTAVGVGCFGVVILMTRAVPAEVLHAVQRR